MLHDKLSPIFPSLGQVDNILLDQIGLPRPPYKEAESDRLSSGGKPPHWGFLCSALFFVANQLVTISGPVVTHQKVLSSPHWTLNLSITG